MRFRTQKNRMRIHPALSSRRGLYIDTWTEKFLRGDPDQRSVSMNSQICTLLTAIGQWLYINWEIGHNYCEQIPHLFPASHEMSQAMLPMVRSLIWKGVMVIWWSIRSPIYEWNSSTPGNMQHLFPAWVLWKRERIVAHNISDEKRRYDYTRVSLESSLVNLNWWVDWSSITIRTPNSRRRPTMRPYRLALIDYKFSTTLSLSSFTFHTSHWHLHFPSLALILYTPARGPRPAKHPDTIHRASI